MLPIGLHLPTVRLRSSGGWSVMELFRRHKPIKPEMVTPPVEPAMRVGSVEARLMEAETRIRHACGLINRDLMAQAARRDSRDRPRNSELIDALLELRSTLQPSAPAPVVPGRST